MPEVGRVRVDHEGAVGVVTIDHPPVNALNRNVVDGLADALSSLVALGIRAVVLRGAGDKAFVAGADITEFPFLTSREEVMRTSQLPHVLNSIASFPWPTIAQIRGYCLGGGLELAMACDLRIAAHDAQLGQPEVKLGLIPGAGGTQRLPRLVGRSRALLLNLLGDSISGQEAYQLGLVDRAVHADVLEVAVTELARSIAAQSPRAVAALKKIHVATAETSLHEGLAQESAAFADCLIGQDGREGVQAFLEKRTPNWDV